MLAQVLNRTIKAGGTTFDWRNQEFLLPDNYWYFPRWPEHTAIVTQNNLAVELQLFITEHEALLAQDDMYLGTWHNPLNDRYYIDIICRERNKNRAIQLAKQYSKQGGRAIVSIYNPKLKQTISL